MKPKDAILILCIIIGLCGHPFLGLLFYLLLTEQI